MIWTWSYLQIISNSWKPTCIPKNTHPSKQFFQSWTYFHKAANSWISIVPDLWHIRSNGGLLRPIYTNDFCCDFSDNFCCDFKRDFVAISNHPCKLLVIQIAAESPWNRSKNCQCKRAFICWLSMHSCLFLSSQVYCHSANMLWFSTFLFWKQFVCKISTLIHNPSTALQTRYVSKWKIAA